MTLWMRLFLCFIRLRTRGAGFRVSQKSLAFFIQHDSPKPLVAEPWVFMGRSGLALAERLTRANLMHFILGEEDV